MEAVDEFPSSSSSKEQLPLLQIEDDDGRMN